MADSEDSTSLPKVSRRAVLAGTGALPFTAQPGAAQSSVSDPALALWRDWQANRRQVNILTRRWQRLEARLAVSVGFPQVEVRLSDNDNPVIAQSAAEIEQLLAHEPEAEKARLIAAFEKQRARWREAAETLGFSAVDAELEAAQEREQDLAASIAETKASSMPGVAVKLAMIIQAGEPAPDDEQSPWPGLRSALSDLTRLGAPRQPPF